MKTKFIQHLCYSNVWISLGAAAFSFLYFYLNGLPPNWTFLSFIFFATLITYTYQRYQKLIDQDRTSGDRMEWMKAHPIIVKAILGISFIACATLVFSLSFSSILLLLLLAVLSFLYAYKFNPYGGTKTNLRDVPGLKIILIGVVWAGSSVLLIDIEFGKLNINSIFSFIGMTLFIIGITIPFDIRDLHLDESSKKTIPQLIGYQPSILLAVVLLLSSSIFIYLGTGFNFWILLCASGLISFSIIPSSPRKSDLFYSFNIDGTLIVYPMIIYLLNNL